MLDLRHGLFCALPICSFKKLILGYITLNKFIHAFEPLNADKGASITYSTQEGRKSFSLPRPKIDSLSAPTAIESFAIDPEVYHQRMEMVEALVKKQK